MGFLGERDGPPPSTASQGRSNITKRLGDGTAGLVLGTRRGTAVGPKVRDEALGPLLAAGGPKSVTALIPRLWSWHLSAALEWLEYGGPRSAPSSLSSNLTLRAQGRSSGPVKTRG